MGQASHLLWLVAGVVGLLVGVTTGKLMVAALGLAAIVTSIVALTLFSVPLQIAIWVVLAIALTIVLRSFVPAPVTDFRSNQGKVLQAIYPGQTGNVSYQGTTWKARSHITDVVLESQQPVQVVGREGNTLWVMPNVDASQ